MTHEDAGHYAAKHDPNAKRDNRITEAVKERMSEGKITCAAAHGISKNLDTTPSEIGKTADLMEVRLVKCQLGLFGYEPEKKIVTPAEEIAPDISNAIQESVENNRVSCASCWNIAEKLNCSKIDVSAACEKMGIKVSPCQLGAF
jgi:hypothetical protein